MVEVRNGWLWEDGAMKDGAGEVRAMAEFQNTARSQRLAKYVFVGAAVLVSAIVSYPWPRRAEPLIAVEQRKVLGEFELAQLDGGRWRLGDHRGQVVLLNYWASWCGPCRTETPGLVRLTKEIGPEKLAVVGISMDTGEIWSRCEGLYAS